MNICAGKTTGFIYNGGIEKTIRWYTLVSFLPHVAGSEVIFNVAILC